MANTQPEDKAKDHRNISFTADYHPWFKTFYGLPYASDIYEFMQTQLVGDPGIIPDKKIIPPFEARGKGTDAAMKRLVDEFGIRQILSVAAGMEPRGIAFASQYPDMVYVETDISDVFQKKSGLADSIFRKYGLQNRQGLHFVVADATDSSQLEKALEFFSPEKPIIIVNEGFLAYYSEAENTEIARIFSGILGRFGGASGKSYWVTSDPSMNAVNRRVLMGHVKDARAMQARVAEKTGRAYDNNGFRDNEHAESLFAGSGLAVERFGQDELGYSLNSLDKVGLDLDTRLLVAENIRKTMQAWVMRLK